MSLCCHESGSGYSCVTYALEISDASDDIKSSSVNGRTWYIVHKWHRMRDKMHLLPVVCHTMVIKQIIIVYEPLEESGVQHK